VGPSGGFLDRLLEELDLHLNRRADSRLEDAEPATGSLVETMQRLAVLTEPGCRWKLAAKVCTEALWEAAEAARVTLRLRLRA
jgi:hypothetical protein